MKKASLQKQRLTNVAKRLGLKLPQVQILLVQERFLERLVTEDRRHHLIWKGGSLLLRRYSSIQPPRFTTDLDLLVRGATVDDAVNLLSKATQIDLGDGFAFEFRKQVPMKRDTPYGGERLEISWRFNDKPNSEPLRIDLCAGDDVDVIEIKLETAFLDSPERPSLGIQVYPPEFIFAEKLETVSRFGTGNTRLKDFIDLWTLIQGGLDLAATRDATIRCYSRRDSDFDMTFLEQVLRDQNFAEELERARLRNFSGLNIPEMHQVLKNILDFVRKMNQSDTR